MKRITFLLILSMISLLTPTSIAQDKQLSIDDAVIGVWRDLAPERLRNLQWQGNTENISYIEADKLIQQKAGSNDKRAIISLDRLNMLIVQKKVDQMPRFPYISWKTDKSFSFQTKGHWFLVDPFKEKVLEHVNISTESENTDFHFDSGKIAYTLGNNLSILLFGGKHFQVTNERDLNIVSGQETARREFGISKGTFWSPDGEYLAYTVNDQSEVTDYPLVDITKRIAVVKNTKYPMAGMPSETVKLHVRKASEKGKTTVIKTNGPDNEYLTNISWTPDSKNILIAELNREQNHMYLNMYDAESGKLLRTLFEETHDKYVEPQHPASFVPGQDDQFIWQSRRSGFNHLYLYNTEGEMLKQLTKGPWEVSKLVGFDKKAQHIIIESTKESPIERHIYAVDMNTADMKKISREAGEHHASLSPNGSMLIDNFSSTEVPNAYRIYTSDGELIQELLTSGNPLREYAIGDMELGTIKAADDSTDLYYRLIKPSPFDPEKQYPAIIYVYGGPHAQLVSNSWLGGARAWQFYMAQNGYVMFTLDNRGSANRGLEFENIIHRHLGTHERADQLKGVEFLSSLPYVDTTRLGIHGWSYGGFMTTGLMLYNTGLFKVGVAGGPVTDWKYYEVMYGERYMDTPEENPEGYAEARLTDKAGQLEDRLMMIHGGIDPTVVHQHSLVFVRECIKNGIPIDYFVYPRAEHNVHGFDRVHLMQKVTQYFEDYLK